MRLKARLLDVRRLETDFGHVRIGIVVPKYGFSSVQRNKLKRRLRELARLRLLGVRASCDVLMRARREAYHAPVERLQGDVELLATQLS